MVKYAGSNLDSVFAALADPTRRAILEKLTRGRATVSELAQPFTISLAAVSKHISVLSDAGLIEIKKDGRFHRIDLRTGTLKDAAAWLDRYEKFWSKRLDALEGLLTSPKHSKK